MKNEMNTENRASGAITVRLASRAGDAVGGRRQEQLWSGDVRGRFGER